MLCNLCGKKNSVSLWLLPVFCRKILNIQIYLSQTTMALNQILDLRYSPDSGLGSYTTCTHIPLSRGPASAVSKAEEATSQLWDWPHTPAESFLQDETSLGAIISLKSRSFPWGRVVVSTKRFPEDKYSICTEFVPMGREPHWITPGWTEIRLWSHSNWLQQWTRF